MSDVTVIPQDWNLEPLRSIAEIHYGKSPKEILSAEGVIPVFGTGGVERYGADHLFDGDSIVLGRKGTIDRVQFVRGKFWAIDTTFFLEISDGILPRWLYYFLQTVDLRGMNEATGVPSLSRDRLYKIDIPTPTKPDQSKIAEVLSTVDRAIEQTEAVIAKQQRIKTGLMQDLLTKGIDEDGNLRSEATHEFKDSPLGRIPKEWEVTYIRDHSDIITSGSRGWAQYYRQEGDVFLRIGNLTREHINLRFNDLVYVQPPNSSEGKRTKLKDGDILISITADLGIIGVIPRDFPDAYVNQHIALVRLDGECLYPRFVGWFLMGLEGRKQFEKHNESGAKSGLNLPAIGSLQVVLPSLDEQRQMSKLLDDQTEKANLLHRRLHKLQSLKTALMQDLLTGKVRVTPLLKDNPQN